MSEQSPVKITVTENGWYQAERTTQIIASDGSLIREGDKFFLCRCGHSNVKPFCDNTHKTCGFVDDGLGKKPKKD
ncbi:MAG: CDGSH iron-sulfur domain-containing protein [Actinobacteria bacterium]|nr:CDGSH iron-sulfur domain-containing protein [Actinomycetota bacterium]